MGAERVGQRQRIRFFLAAGLISLIMANGCRTVALPPEDGNAAREDQLERQLLDRAAVSLERREYAAVLDATAKAISCCRGRYPEQALRILEAAMAAPDNPIGRSSSTISCLKGTEKPFSGPVTAETARCRVTAMREILANEAEVLKLKRRVRRLERQIEQLKAVDLEPELPEPGGKSP